jgi:hypothetical protein
MIGFLSGFGEFLQKLGNPQNNVGDDEQGGSEHTDGGTREGGNAERFDQVEVAVAGMKHGETSSL